MGEVDINELLSTVSDNKDDWHQLGDGTDVKDLPLEIQTFTRGMALLRMVTNYNRGNSPIPFFVKSHTACMQINGIELFPDLLTKATIFIVRDPRDVLPSFANHMGVDLDQALEWMSERYRILNSPDGVTVKDFISSWGDHASSFLETKSHNVRVFRFEDLKANPVETFEGILRHAGITPERKKVERALEVVALDKLKEQESEKGFSEASKKAKNPFFHKGSVGGWKDKLTAKHIYTIEKRFGSVMKRLGYIKKRRAA